MAIPFPLPTRWSSPAGSKSLGVNFNWKRVYRQFPAGPGEHHELSPMPTGGFFPAATKLHAENTSQKNAAETLKSLESYKSLDPFSGKPYSWNSEKKRLYSFGFDQ